MVAVSVRRGGGAFVARVAALGMAVAVMAPTTPTVAAPPLRLAIGAPYQADGLWWVPALQPTYEAVGEARETLGLRGAPSLDAPAVAHATLPIATLLDVTNLDTGRTARLQVARRGGTAPGRVLDLSPEAAQALGGGGPRVRVTVAHAASPRRLAAVSAPALRAEPPRLRTEVSPAYAVQAGAFAERERAERLANRLAQVGEADVVAATAGGRTLWRVTIASRDAAGAEAVRQRLAEMGVEGARVLRAS